MMTDVSKSLPENIRNDPLYERSSKILTYILDKYFADNINSVEGLYNPDSPFFRNVEIADGTETPTDILSVRYDIAPSFPVKINANVLQQEDYILRTMSKGLFEALGSDSIKEALAILSANLNNLKGTEAGLRFVFKIMALISFESMAAHYSTRTGKALVYDPTLYEPLIEMVSWKDVNLDKERWDVSEDMAPCTTFVILSWPLKLYLETYLEDEYIQVLMETLMWICAKFEFMYIRTHTDHIDLNPREREICKPAVIRDINGAYKGKSKGFFIGPYSWPSGDLDEYSQLIIGPSVERRYFESGCVLPAELWRKPMIDMDIVQVSSDTLDVLEGISSMDYDADMSWWDRIEYDPQLIGGFVIGDGTLINELEPGCKIEIIIGGNGAGLGFFDYMTGQPEGGYNFGEGIIGSIIASDESYPSYPNVPVQKEIEQIASENVYMEDSTQGMGDIMMRFYDGYGILRYSFFNWAAGEDEGPNFVTDTVSEITDEEKTTDKIVNFVERASNISYIQGEGIGAFIIGNATILADPDLVIGDFYIQDGAVGAINPRDTLTWIIQSVDDPILLRTPSELDFVSVPGGTLEPQIFSISNGGAGTFNYSITVDQPWVGIDPYSGSCSSETDDITVIIYSGQTISAGGIILGDFAIGEVLESGAHYATITITSPTAFESPKHVIVEWVLVGYELNVSTDLLAKFGNLGANPENSTFDVWNGSEGTMGYSISSSQPWLSFTPDSGSSTGEHDTIQVGFDIDQLAEGNHTAVITVTAGTQEALIDVQLTVSGYTLVVDRGNIDTTGAVGGSPASTTFNVYNGMDYGGGTPTSMPYTIECSETWLSVLPVSGTSTGEQDEVTVSFDTGALGAGIYEAQITVTAGTQSHIVDVEVVLAVEGIVDNFESYAIGVPPTLDGGTGFLYSWTMRDAGGWYTDDYEANTIGSTDTAEMGGTGFTASVIRGNYIAIVASDGFEEYPVENPAGVIGGGSGWVGNATIRDVV